MDASGVSVLSYRRSKPQGKVRRRVQNLRIPSSYSDFVAGRPTLDLSHNESARLAADSLLSRGLQGYHEVLQAEGEVDFLSELEKIYILENGRDGSTADPGESDDDDKEFESFSACSQSATRCPMTSTDSEPSVAGLDPSSLKDVQATGHVLEENKFEVYFQSDSRAAGTKDLVREFIRKATMALAIVIDSFSDVELLCDLLEASRKRNVSVHLLLDHLNLDLFVSVWQDLKLDSKNFPKLSVRSISGQTYCAKTGRRLTGQIAESFIITDWTEVLTGSFSFSWLSWQVHRSLAVLLKGRAVLPFHQEFHRLYSSSASVPGFVTYINLPPHTTLHAARNENADVTESKSSQTKTVCQRVWDDDAQNIQTTANMPVLSNPELECSKGHTQSLHRAGPGTHMHEKPKPLVQPGALKTVSTGKTKRILGAFSTQPDAQKKGEPLEENKNKIQSCLNPLSQTPFPDIQSQLTSLTITTTAEKNVKAEEPNVPHTDSPRQGPQRAVHYQSLFKTAERPDLQSPHYGARELNQRTGDRLIKPAGLNPQRRQWYCSLNFKQKVDFVADHPTVQSPSTPQQKQSKTGVLFPSAHLRGHTSALPTGTRGQDQLLRPHQPLHQSHPPTEAPTAPTTVSTRLKPQLQSNSRLFSPATGTKLHLQPHSCQQVTPTSRLNWSQAARPRPVARHSSFGTTYGMGQQVGWRPFHSGMTPPLGRSKSMTDRHSAGFRGAGVNTNTTIT